jgi:hypothetical protein
MTYWHPQPAPVHRTPITGTAILAGYRAHKTDTHHGHVAPGCRTCAGYLAALYHTGTLTQQAP